MVRVASWPVVVAACAALVACSSSPSASQGSEPATAATTEVSAPSTTLAATTTAPPTTAATTTAAATTAVATTTVDPDLVRRVFPVQDAAAAGWSETHHDYPATDIFHPGGCGTAVVAPVDGTVLEVRFDDLWSSATDDPSARGGRYLSILGDDGVRYYMAHFQSLDGALAPGVRVAAGQVVGEMGRSGRAGACHLHFALSPPCPNDEWWVRRGVVWPYPYLADWQRGVNTSPVGEVRQWAADHPDACVTAPAG